MSTKRALLVMAYGTPDTLADVEPYYTHIRRGRAPSPEQLQALIARYERVGGVTPLREITFAQAGAIRDALAARGVDLALYVGMKHWRPYIADAIRSMAADGVTDAVGIVLAPHYSRASIGQYLEQAEGERAVSAPQLRFRAVERWGASPALLSALEQRVQEALGTQDRARTLVVFTAHSLPVRIRTWDDPYEREVAATAEAVAHALRLPHWRIGWQSAGATPEPWIGPDLLTILREAAGGGAFDGAVVCPVGFTADHLEILYDLDIEAAAIASELGLAFGRTRSMNTDPRFIQAAADEVAALWRTPGAGG